MMYAEQCKPGKVHRWSHDEFNSGWCVHGCGNRDDGRITSRSGDVLREAIGARDESSAAF